MGRKKLYEVECNRTNISAKQFWSYCKRRFEEKTGLTFSWIDSYTDWVSPTMPCNNIWKHDDWNVPATEVCKILPYEWHQCLTGAYNFIMEYDDGHGYMYAIEWEV